LKPYRFQVGQESITKDDVRITVDVNENGEPANDSMCIIS
jgi:hypothetical protein